MLFHFKNPLFERLLGLFSYGWWVDVDTDARMVRAKRREGYYGKTREIPFDDVFFYRHRGWFVRRKPGPCG
jgi:hypothetical protein